MPSPAASVATRTSTSLSWMKASWIFRRSSRGMPPWIETTASSRPSSARSLRDEVVQGVAVLAEHDQLPARAVASYISGVSWSEARRAPPTCGRRRSRAPAGPAPRDRPGLRSPAPARRWSGPPTPRRRARPRALRARRRGGRRGRSRRRRRGTHPGAVDQAAELGAALADPLLGEALLQALAAGGSATGRSLPATRPGGAAGW